MVAEIILILRKCVGNLFGPYYIKIHNNEYQRGGCNADCTESSERIANEYIDAGASIARYDG